MAVPVSYQNYHISSNLPTFAFNLSKIIPKHATKYNLIFFCSEKELFSLAFLIFFLTPF